MINMDAISIATQPFSDGLRMIFGFRTDDDDEQIVGFYLPAEKLSDFSNRLVTSGVMNFGDDDSVLPAEENEPARDETLIVLEQGVVNRLPDKGTLLFGVTPILRFEAGNTEIVQPFAIHVPRKTLHDFGQGLRRYLESGRGRN